LRDAQVPNDRVAGRAVIRYLEVEGTEELWSVTQLFNRALKGRLGHLTRPEGRVLFGKLNRDLAAH
jgi:hypothetical protein